MSATCKVTDEAFVTLATTDSYAIGALVLGHSLRAVGTTRQLVVLITNEVTQHFRTLLEGLFDVVTVVDLFNSNDTANLALLTRPDLGVTFTKLHCWRLTQFRKCVFLDADTLVVQNIDDLFDREELSAAPDAGWPDCFNSGVFVFRPSDQTYADLVQFSLTHGSFDERRLRSVLSRSRWTLMMSARVERPSALGDIISVTSGFQITFRQFGGDQGLLNLFFSSWSTADASRRLPFTYNVVSTTFYSYLPAFKQYGKNTKVLHFIGPVKPWHTSYNLSTGHVQVQGDAGNYTLLLKLWWNVFMDKVRPKLEDKQVPTLQSTDLNYSLSNYTHHQLGDTRRQHSWERGQVDYLGIDSFENILAQLNTKLA